MGNIFQLNPKRVFTLSEAQELLPLIRRITDEYSRRVQAHLNRLEAVKVQNEEMAVQIEGDVNELFQSWQNKLSKLGVQPKGLWLVDFDSGEGYYCWKYPETRIEYWHRYSDGFSGRKKLAESVLRPLDSEGPLDLNL